jgi:hypothetical protein
MNVVVDEAPRHAYCMCLDCVLLAEGLIVAHSLSDASCVLLAILFDRLNRQEHHCVYSGGVVVVESLTCCAGGLEGEKKPKFGKS